MPEEILGRPGTRGARRFLLALVRGQFERNEMLPRKLDRTGTNAHTSIGARAARAGAAPADVLPTICQLWPRTSSPSMLLTRGRFNYRHN